MKSVEFATEEHCLRPTLRLAIVTETYPPEVNGVAMTLGRMVDGLLAQGHHIQLVRPRQTRSDAAADAEGYTEVLARGVPIPRYGGLRFGLPARTGLIRLWSRQRPDLVHVVTEGPLGWSAVSAARKLGLVVTSGFHTNFDYYSQHYGIGWLEQPVAAWLKRLHNRTAITFVPTEAMARDLRKRGYKRVEVISRGVDTTLFNPQRRSAELRKSWGVNDDDVVVLSVGRLAPEKNLPLTVRAFKEMRAQHPRVKLVMVGDGPMRQELESQNADFHFAGVRTGIDLAQHYASADVFLFPSLSETFGNVTLEALASGLCVLAYRCAAAEEVIRHGDNGLVVTPGDEAAFIAQATALVRDEALRSRIRERASPSVAAHDWTRVHASFASALRGAVAEAQASDPTLAAFSNGGTR